MPTCFSPTLNQKKRGLLVCYQYTSSFKGRDAYTACFPPISLVQAEMSRIEKQMGLRTQANKRSSSHTHFKSWMVGDGKASGVDQSFWLEVSRGHCGNSSYHVGLATCLPSLHPSRSSLHAESLKWACRTDKWQTWHSHFQDLPLQRDNNIKKTVPCTRKCVMIMCFQVHEW